MNAKDLVHKLDAVLSY